MKHGDSGLVAALLLVMGSGACARDNWRYPAPSDAGSVDASTDLPRLDTTPDADCGAGLVRLGAVCVPGQPCPAGACADAAASPTWLSHTPAVSARGDVDTSANPHLDVNGDGFDDVAIGAYTADPSGRVDAGTASVFHGGPTGLAGVAAVVLTGDAAYDRFGISVASAGDVDGDGFSDVVVGAVFGNPDNRINAGIVRVFRGSAAGLSTVAAQTVAGDGAGYQFGNQVAGLGDVNGDGYSDFVAGANGARPGGRERAGSASIFHGSAAGVPTVATRVLNGPNADDRWGVAVACAVNPQTMAAPSLLRTSGRVPTLRDVTQRMRSQHRVSTRQRTRSRRPPTRGCTSRGLVVAWGVGQRPDPGPTAG